MNYKVQIGDTTHDVTIADGVATIGGASYSVALTAIPGTPTQLLTVDRQVHRIIPHREAGRGAWTLRVDGWTVKAEALEERQRALRDLHAATAGPKGPSPLVAPMPGLIVRIHVAVGDEVAAGQGLVAMEAMKMENELKSPGAGRVKTILVQPGQAVEKGALLVEME